MRASRGGGRQRNRDLTEVQANEDLSPERSCKPSPLKNGNGSWGTVSNSWCDISSAHGKNRERLREFGALPATGPTGCRGVHTWDQDGTVRACLHNASDPGRGGWGFPLPSGSDNRLIANALVKELRAPGLPT